MYQGNWTCSKCGGEITELPFEPRNNSGLTCKACFIKAKQAEQGGAEASSADVAGAADDAPPPEPDFPDNYDAASEPAPPPPADLDGAEPINPGERKMFTGDWACAGCGAPITQLPFEPRNTSNLKCLDCFKQSKA
jgi:CxxC-x17-CxxC domain-containing protein